MKTLILAACLLATINLSVADSVPVFLWGGANENDLPVPTLHQLTENEFSSIVAAKLKPETFTVVFQERKVRLCRYFRVRDLTSKNQNFPVT
jgi:hypothetical protein